MSESVNPNRINPSSVTLMDCSVRGLLGDENILQLSHELRTPLTSILGVLGLLSSGKLHSRSEEGKRLVNIALNNTNRLIRLAQAMECESVPSLTNFSEIDLEHLQLENELYEAWENRSFHVVYQPIANVKTNHTVGFEALVRWDHPFRGAIAPTVFIPIAEENGIIDELGLWVLEQACQQLAKWTKLSSQQSLMVSVNLSARQLRCPDLSEKITQVLQNTGASPQSLVLEITESALIENYEMALATLRKLQAMGIRIYVDDFGTGYSSLARLQDLPVDGLKIDGSFVRKQQWGIIQTILLLVSNLGLVATTEGIEDAETLDALRTMGCAQGQGYFFSPPLTAQQVPSLLDPLVPISSGRVMHASPNTSNQPIIV